MTEPAHSKFSASASARWLNCPGSMVLSVGKKSKASIHSAEGTVAHKLFEDALNGVEPPTSERVGEVFEQDGFTIVVVDQEMVDAVTTAFTNTHIVAPFPILLQAETRVNYSTWLGVPEADGWGTADVIAVVGTELQVHDLKYGKGVEVDAKDNSQMLLYAGGALLEVEAFAEIETVRLVIHQPRISKAPSEWAISVDELKAWLNGRARSGAASVLNAESDAVNNGGTFGAESRELWLRPGDKQCRWCAAKATCPALRREVAETVAPITAEDFDDLTVAMPKPDESPDVVAFCLSKVDLIEDWCKAIRAEAERRLQAGEPVPGYKLVQGKRGARQWADPAEAEAMLKTFRLKQEEMFDFKLISPTTAEKLAKAETIGKRQWPKLQALITQPEGKAHVAPASDPRPALDVKPVEEMFEDNTSDDISNLV